MGQQIRRVVIDAESSSDYGDVLANSSSSSKAPMQVRPGGAYFYAESSDPSAVKHAIGQGPFGIPPIIWAAGGGYLVYSAASAILTLIGVVAVLFGIFHMLGKRGQSN
jgi:hypothetical protein